MLKLETTAVLIIAVTTTLVTKVLNVMEGGGCISPIIFALHTPLHVYSYDKNAMVTTALNMRGKGGGEIISTYVDDCLQWKFFLTN